MGRQNQLVDPAVMEGQLSEKVHSILLQNHHRLEDAKCHLRTSRHLVWPANRIANSLSNQCMVVWILYRNSRWTRVIDILVGKEITECSRTCHVRQVREAIHRQQQRACHLVMWMEIEKHRSVCLSMKSSGKTQALSIRLDQQHLVYHVVNTSSYMGRNGSTIIMVIVLRAHMEMMRELRNSSRRGGNLSMLLA